MGINNRIAGFAFSVILVILLALPALRWLELRAPDGVLYGYSDSLPSPPHNLVHAFFDRSLQHWVEKNFEISLGFRALLIRSFNELNFRLFRESPKLQLYTTSAHGLYSKMSIDSLNDEVVRRKILEERYRIEAEKLLRVQRQLQSQGKHFEVIIATSKPYVYPNSLGLRYLAGGSSGIFERAANFGNALRDAGVNVIDGGPLLRKFAAKTILDTHPDSGVHWNYYAGCLVAHELLNNIRNRKFANIPMLDCGKPHLADPHMVDVDGLLLLNIWSNGGVAKPMPYPTILKNGKVIWRPDIVFVGDSFSDQIRYALQQANAYSVMTTSSYFKLRQIDDKKNNIQSTDPVETDMNVTRAKLMNDIDSSDIIILQMVDYNVQRWGYGFADYFLTKQTDAKREIQIASIVGAYDRETDGKNWWHWVKSKITFRLQSLFITQDAIRTKLHFEYRVRGTQKLTVQIANRDGYNQKIILQSTKDSNEVFEQIIDVPPFNVDRISIETDSVALPLSESDTRVAAWMVKNVVITPVFAEK